MQRIALDVVSSSALPLEVKNDGGLSLTVEPVRKIFNERPAFDGPYAVTPSDAEQTLSTNGKRMTADVVIAPIPSNYGLVTWNGTFLTIS